MSQRANTAKGIDGKGEEEDVVCKQILGDRRGRGGDTSIVGAILTVKLAKFSNAQRVRSGIRCRWNAAAS